IEDHFLVAEPWRRKERREPDDGRGHLADLLVTLPDRGVLRLLPFVDAAGRQFPQEPVDRVTVLTDQDDVIRLRYGQQHHRPRMTHQVHGHFAAVRQPHAVTLDREHLALKDALGTERLWFGHVTTS